MADSYTQAFQIFKDQSRWRGNAEIATLTQWKEDFWKGKDEDPSTPRLTSKELAITASFTTLTTSGALVGGSLLAAGSDGAAALYGSISFGAGTAALGAVTTAGVTIGVGMLAAGIIDFITRVAQNDRFYFKFGDPTDGCDISFSQALEIVMLKLFNTIRAAILTPFYLVTHAILFIGYVCALIKNYLKSNKEGIDDALENTSENAREICLNLAGIILFPLFNALDFTLSILTGLGKTGKAAISLATCGIFCDSTDEESNSNLNHTL